MAVLSVCNILKAVLEVIGVPLYREKVKLAAPERVLYLRSHIQLFGQDILTTTSVLRFILVLTQFPATGLYGKTSWIHLSNLVTKTNVNGEVFIKWRPDGLMVSALVSGSKALGPASQRSPQKQLFMKILDNSNHAYMREVR